MNELKSPLISDEQAALIAKGDSDVLNCEEAKEFIKSVPDSADREALWLAYGVLGLGMSGVDAAGKIDVLYFMKVFAKVLEQRDELLRILGTHDTHETGLHQPMDSNGLVSGVGS